MKIKKPIFITLLILLVCNTQQNQVLAQNINNAALNNLENMLFEKSYSNQSAEERLSRIEKMIYGHTFEEQSISERAKRLRAFIPVGVSDIEETTETTQQKSDSKEHSFLPEKTESKELPSFDHPDKKLPDNLDELLKSYQTDYVDDTLPPREKTIFTEEPGYHKPQKRSKSPEKAIRNYEDIPGLMYENQNLPERNTVSHPEAFNRPESDQTAYNSPLVKENEGPGAEYPVIDNIERDLFGQSYQGQNIYQRLERLEKKLAGKVSTGSLYDRVDKIIQKANYNTVKERYADQYKPVIAGNNAPSAASSYNMNQQQASPYGSTSQNYRSMSNHASIPVQRPSGQPDSMPGAAGSTGFGVIGNQLSELEQQLFGRTYDDDLSLNRIDRIEKRVTGKTSFGLVDDRIEKVYAAMGMRSSPGASSRGGYYFTDDGYDRSSGNTMSSTSSVPGQFMFGGSMQSNTDQVQRRLPYSNVPASNPSGQNEALVSQVEMQIFRKTYPDLDLTTRVSRLENTLFGQMSGGDLVPRIQRLIQAAHNPYYSQPAYGYNQGYNNYDPYNSYNNGYNTYGSNNTPYYNNYYSAAPITPRNLVGAAAGAAIDKATGGSGILSQIGKAAGSALLGVPATGYNNGYGYNNYGGYNNSYYGY